MSLSDDLKKSVAEILARTWTKRDGRVVPEPAAVGLGNQAVNIDGTVLYADLGESTAMVDTKTPEFAAEIYKSYLHCAAKIIRSENGVITAYDGDRIMAVYLGDWKNQSAARTALKINYAVQRIINPAITNQYGSIYEVKQVVGIDTSSLLVAQTGIRGSNDLVWVGRAANHAAKLSGLSTTFPSRITKEVYDRLPPTVKELAGKPMWEQATWTAMANRIIYRSTWIWAV